MSKNTYAYGHLYVSSIRENGIGLPCGAHRFLFVMYMLIAAVILVSLPGTAIAAINVLDAFPAIPQIRNVTVSPSTASYTPSGGSNRIILISVHDHTNNTTATNISVAYGSNNIPARLIVNSPNNQRRQVWLFYLNESDIAAATGNTITVTNNNVGSGMSAYVATLSGVDQASTIVATPYSIYNPNVSYSFAVAIGGYAMFASTDNTLTDPTTNEGYTGNASIQVGSAYSYVADMTFAAAATTNPVYTTDATFNGFGAAAFNPAAAGAPGSLQLSSSTYSVNENGGSATITVTRTGGSSGAVGISYATANGSATGADYTAASGTLSWVDGDASSKTFTVAITDDLTVEGNETFDVSISGPTGGATLGSPSTGTVTIVDNEAVPAQVPAGSTMLYALLAGAMAVFAVRKTQGKRGRS